MQTINLTQGKSTIVDDEDFEWLNQWKWLYSTGYAIRNQWFKKEKCYRPICMHRLILNTPIGLYTDHIDRNGLNNQKNNLRIVTNRQNLMNRTKQKNNTSGYKGVQWDKTNKKWTASIMVFKKNIHLGRFEKIEEAILAYNNGAKKYFGKYAYFNKV